MVAEFEGVLLHNAEARSRLLDAEGHVVPVLCLDVAVGPQRKHAHFEQPFPAGAFQACAIAALRLKKGAHLTLTHGTADLRLLGNNVSHVHVHHPQPEDSNPS